MIGIIALLISVLLPTLHRARQAAENAACLSNLRQIGVATIMYKTDTGRIPFFFVLRNYPWQPVAQGASGNTVWWTAFSFGGKTTHDTISVGYMDDALKPLDKYIWHELASERWTGAKTAAALRAQRNVFRCPADGPGGMGRGIGVPLDYLAPGVGSPYEAYGTSYMSNRGFMYDSKIISLYYSTITTPITDEKVNYLNAGVSKIVKSWSSSETYVAADIWFLWSLYYHQAVPGAHSSQSIHNAVFLDGHAAPAYVTAHDVASWGPRNASQYVPKSGDGWREVGTYDPKVQSPWSGTDPFGGSNNRGQAVAGG